MATLTRPSIRLWVIRSRTSKRTYGVCVPNCRPALVAFVQETDARLAARALDSTFDVAFPLYTVTSTSLQAPPLDIKDPKHSVVEGMALRDLHMECASGLLDLMVCKELRSARRRLHVNGAYHHIRLSDQDTATTLNLLLRLGGQRPPHPPQVA